MTTTRVYIVFFSGRAMNFKVISELSGADPTYIEIKGKSVISQITGEVVRINRHNVFEYRLPKSHGRLVNSQFNKLMRAIKNPRQLGDYCKAHGIKVRVEVVIEGVTDTYSFPSLHLDRRFVSFLSDLNNAEVDFDIYTERWDKEGDDYKEPAIKLPSGESLYKL